MAGSQKMGVMMWKPFNPEDVTFLKKLLEAGKLKPVIDRSYPLREVPQALRYQQEGRPRGKVVITV
jgi:NADPH:quinone reductase-like Zn-dependent oxidoreductase